MRASGSRMYEPGHPDEESRLPAPAQSHFREQKQVVDTLF